MRRVTSVLHLVENSCDDGDVSSSPAVMRVKPVLDLADNTCDEGDVSSSTFREQL